MKIYFNWEQVFLKGTILAESRPRYEYNGNQRTEKLLGTNYILIQRPEFPTTATIGWGNRRQHNFLKMRWLMKMELQIAG